MRGESADGVGLSVVLLASIRCGELVVNVRPWWIDDGERQITARRRKTAEDMLSLLILPNRADSKMKKCPYEFACENK